MFDPRQVFADPAVFVADVAELPRTGRHAVQSAAARRLLEHAAKTVLGTSGFRLGEEASGRPTLMLAGSERQVGVSLSHSGTRILCAVALSRRVGVDVERIRPRREWDGLARFTLHPGERSAIDALGEQLRWEAFYRAWTRKEALAKALGAGLAMPFDRILVSDAGTLAEAPEELLAGPPWRFASLDTGPGFAAAVAWSEVSV